MEIKDKVAIVTGASSGIGLATARLLTQKGAKVALVSRSKDKLTALSRKLKNSLAFTADLTKEVEIKIMVNKVKAHYGRVDILVNNAGQGYDASIEKINPDTFRKIFQLDVVGPLIAMQQVIPIMKKRGKGVIVNISSGTALMYLPHMAAYSSLKRALAHLSLTAREEMKKDNISVSVVYPYITQSNFEKNTIKEIDKNNHSEGDDDETQLPPADTSKYVAEKILEAIINEEAEIFAHDWLRHPPGVR